MRSCPSLTFCPPSPLSTHPQWSTFHDAVEEEPSLTFRRSGRCQHPTQGEEGWVATLHPRKELHATFLRLQTREPPPLWKPFKGHPFVISPSAADWEAALSQAGKGPEKRHTPDITTGAHVRKQGQRQIHLAFLWVCYSLTGCRGWTLGLPAYWMLGNHTGKQGAVCRSPKQMLSGHKTEMMFSCSNGCCPSLIGRIFNVIPIRKDSEWPTSTTTKAVWNF